MSFRAFGLAFTALAGVTAFSGAAYAQVFSREAFHGLAEVRLGASDGETSWIDGGFGKTILSGDRGGGLKVEPRLSDVAVEWKPRFTFGVGAVLVAEAQPDLDPALDVTEAYLALRAPPSKIGRLSARLGYVYPPVSLEHDGVAWTTPDMLSASALNSWIGEEVKVVAAEGTLRRSFGAHEVAATAAVFGWNDTSGTLLSFRGWALHGVKAGWNTRFELPQLSRYMSTRQGRLTYPLRELDNRAGYYGRIEWRPPAPVTLEAFYYDNVGDRIAVDSERQWAWETRFLNLGLRWDVDERTTVLAQAMNGETLMGFRTARGHWIDMGFHAAYVLARRQIGEDAISGRLDWFEANDRTLQDVDNNDETGWAVTAAWRKRLAPHADLIVEVQRVASRRPSRALVADPARQTQTSLQTALRLSF